MHEQCCTGSGSNILRLSFNYRPPLITYIPGFVCQTPKYDQVLYSPDPPFLFGGGSGNNTTQKEVVHNHKDLKHTNSSPNICEGITTTGI